MCYVVFLVGNLQSTSQMLVTLCYCYTILVKLVIALHNVCFAEHQ